MSTNKYFSDLKLYCVFKFTIYNQSVNENLMKIIEFALLY